MAKKNGDGGNNRLNGTGGDDQLNGKGGDDTLKGKGGNDKLKGGKGDDELHGGDGKDKFHFDFDSGRDTIIDFHNNQDTIYISKDYGFADIQELLDNCSSSGGDSAIDLSKNGDDAPRIIILGLDNFNKLEDDIVFF